MLTRYKGQLKLKDWAFVIARRSSMRKARVALARRLAIIMHAMLSGRNGVHRGVGLPTTETGDRIELPQGGRPREGADDGVDFVASGITGRLRFDFAALSQLTHQAPASAQRTQASQVVDNRKSLAPLTN